MITLNDYLYSGDTVIKILKKYEADLRKSAKETHSQVDVAHCNFLLQVGELLEHTEFLVSQSQRLREFYQYMVKQYPNLAFTFSGRIKSLIRAEGKFNGYVTEFIYNYYEKCGSFPPFSELKERLTNFRDLIAYRIVISMPRCHLAPGQSQEAEELRCLYEIANKLPEFLEERGFTAELSGKPISPKTRLVEAVRPYYRDYVAAPKTFGYRSLHITFFDNLSRCQTEVQIRTKAMDDNAKIGPANHLGYEQRQKEARARRAAIPVGRCREFDEAWQRGLMLQTLDLSKVDVNMFAAYSNNMMNDSSGLYRGRLITPYEHLSRFQSDIID